MRWMWRGILLRFIKTCATDGYVSFYLLLLATLLCGMRHSRKHFLFYFWILKNANGFMRVSVPRGSHMQIAKKNWPFPIPWAQTRFAGIQNPVVKYFCVTSPRCLGKAMVSDWNKRLVCRNTKRWRQGLWMCRNHCHIRMISSMLRLVYCQSKDTLTTQHCWVWALSATRKVSYR